MQLFKSQSGKRAKRVLAIAALIVAPTIAQADVIVQNTGTPGFPGTFNFIGYNSTNVAFGQPVASQFLEFGGRFHPSGSNANQTFAANTTVTATQNGVQVNVPYANSIPDPNLFDARIAYNPNLLGSWQLTVSNPHYTNTLTLNTAAIQSNIGVPPFITGIAISGASNATTTPTISWNAPAYAPPAGYNQATRVFIVDLDNNRQTIFRVDLPSNQTSFTIPVSANLSPTGHYGVVIRDDFRISSNATTGASSHSFFPFVRVTSTFPTSAKGTESQRQRWVQGHLATIGKFVPRLLAVGLRRGDINVLALALDLLVPPLSLLALLMVGTTVLTSSVALLGGPWLPALIAGGNLVGFFLCVALAWFKFGRQVFPAHEALSFGTFALKKIQFYGRMLIGGTASQWIRTDRSTPN